MRRKDKAEMSLRRKLVLAGVVFIVLVLFVSSFFGKRGLMGIYHANKTKTSLNKEIERLKQEKIRLEREMEELRNNPMAVDQTVREKLWLMPPDEIVIIKAEKDPDTNPRDKKR